MKLLSGGFFIAGKSCKGLLAAGCAGVVPAIMDGTGAKAEPGAARTVGDSGEQS
jgi:hypothetical protein